MRGNYTLTYEKKPIRIKFSKKQNLLGMHNGGKYKNWVLLADWKDLSMLNNVTAFYLAQQILGADGYYCTDYRPVEVYLNDQYWGVYLLAEQQEAKDGRFSVPEVPDNYTGTDVGYLFEYDAYYTEERAQSGGDPTFEVDYGNSRYTQIGYTVKSDINGDAQRQFIQGYTQNVFHLLQSAANGTLLEFNAEHTALVPSTAASAKEAIAKAIDLNSLVDSYLFNEIVFDSDIGWSSFYLSLDMTPGGKQQLTFEGPWDFDSSLGMRQGYTDHTATPGRDGTINGVNPWLSVLADEDWFIDMVKVRWNTLLANGILDNALAQVDHYTTTYRSCYERNYARWPGRIQYGNGEVVPELDKNKTQADGAAYLKNWLTKRIAFLKEQWN